MKDKYSYDEMLGLCEYMTRAEIADLVKSGAGPEGFIDPRDPAPEPEPEPAPTSDSGLLEGLLAVADAIRNQPPPVVNVTVTPEVTAKIPSVTEITRITRDAAGNLTGSVKERKANE